MTSNLENWAQKVRQLHTALSALCPLAESHGVAPSIHSEESPHREWYDLLEHKLLPQFSGRPMLVVAVVGGTNIGKSLVFNHLAGEDASGVSPLAAGTKHPVCLVPRGFHDEHVLSQLFEGFRLRPWQSSHDPLHEDEVADVFWRVGKQVPERLLLLDTPDIDSDHKVNWYRADLIRHAADVLIAVLTQQKYNDAAVKQFFRKVAEADKPVIIVFNQCDLEGDRAVWSHWLSTFTSETGVDPLLVYVVPYDRTAAKTLQLPFYDVGPEATNPPNQPRSLRSELASLRFDEIKIRTFRGAIAKVLDPVDGAPAYLLDIRLASGEFAAALAALSSIEMSRVQWPSLPSQLLVDEIRNWWDTHRSQWARKVHSFYRTLGRGVTWPVRTALGAIISPSIDPLVEFQRRERHAIVIAVGNLLDELKRLSDLGNDTLKPRLAKLLKGESRASLLTRVEASHAELPAVDDQYRQFLRRELDQWGQENPNAIFFLRSLDHVSAVARPAITVSLVVSGWALAGGMVHEAAVHAATHTATEIATEAALTGGIATGGEALVDATSSRVRLAAARLFGQLQSRYAQQRAEWLAHWLEAELLGDLLTELQRCATIPNSAPFRAVEQALDELATPDLVSSSK